MNNLATRSNSSSFKSRTYDLPRSRFLSSSLPRLVPWIGLRVYFIASACHWYHFWISTRLSFLSSLSFPFPLVSSFIPLVVMLVVHCRPVVLLPHHLFICYFSFLILHWYPDAGMLRIVAFSDSLPFHFIVSCFTSSCFGSSESTPSRFHKSWTLVI